MSRSVFANTIGAFVLDGVPSQVARSNDEFSDFGRDLVSAGAGVVRDTAVDYIEDEYGSAAGTVAGQAISAGYNRAGIPSQGQQQQQSVPQGYNPMNALKQLAANRVTIPTALMNTNQLFSPAMKQVMADREREQQARNIALLQSPGIQGAAFGFDESSEATGETSEVTSKDKKNKPFFKTGAGIATILVGAAAIAGGIVYFATQE